MRNLNFHSFTESLLGKASMYANNFVAADGAVTVKEGPEDTLKVDVLNENGESLGLVDVDVWVNESLEDLELPNGGKVGDMKNYGWKEFKELETMAQEYEAAKEFADALDGIPGGEKEDGLTQ